MAQQQYGHRKSIGTGTVIVRGADNWTQRCQRTVGMRARSDGPLLPMDKATFLSRIFGVK